MLPRKRLQLIARTDNCNVRTIQLLLRERYATTNSTNDRAHNGSPIVTLSRNARYILRHHMYN